MFTLAYPWFLALLPAPWLVRWLLPAREESTTGLRVPFLDRIARATRQTPGTGAVIVQRDWLEKICLSLTWILVLTALARPQWLEPPITRTIPVRDLLLAVDLSGSMQTKDFTDANGKAVDRLTAVKQILDDFLSRRQGDRVGLIVFGNAPFVQAPFTQDLTVCRELLSEMQIGMAGPKTAMGDAIGLAISVFDRTNVPERVLIVLTDGNDTGSLVPPVKAAEIAKDKKIVLYTVAVGDPKAAGEDKLDEATLKQISEMTGGTYSHASNRAELEAIYKHLDQLPTQPAETITHRPRRDLFHWFLGAGLLISFVPALTQVFVHRQTQRPAERRSAA